MIVALGTILAVGFGSLLSGGVFVGIGVIIGHIITVQALANQAE